MRSNEDAYRLMQGYVVITISCFVVDIPYCVIKSRDFPRKQPDTVALRVPSGTLSKILFQCEVSMLDSNLALI